MMVAGFGGMLAVFVAGRLGMSQWTGIGPVERAVLLSGLAFGLAGIPMLRQGDVPLAATREPRYAASLPRPQTRWEQIAGWAGHALMALALLAYLGYLGIYVAYAAELFRWPYDYDQGESFELYDAVLHSQGEWPYRQADTFPFYSSNYPPVFHLLMLPLFPIFGQRLLAGRVLSFTITLLTAAMLGITVRRRTGGLFIPVIAALSYTASNFVYHVGPLCRQHLTMILFETLAVYFIAGAIDAGPEGARFRWRNTLVGLFFMLVAGYTKQLAVFTSVAIFGYLFLHKPWRAVGLAAGFGAVFGAVFLWLNWATGGQWWLNTIAANVNAFLMPQLIGLTQTWLKVHTLYIVLAVAMVLYEAYRGRLSIYAFWFCASLGTGLMSGKWGAGAAYWVTSVAAAIVLTGFALGHARDWIAQHKAQWTGAFVVLVPLLFLVQAPRMLHLPTAGPFWGPVARVFGVEGESVYGDYPYFDTVGYTQVGHFLLPRDYAGGARIMEYVENAEGLVFSEEAAFTMLAGKPVVTNPTQLLNLYNNGLLDTSELEAMIRAEAFDVVILRAQFYPHPVLVALGEHYGVVEHVPMKGFNYIIMLPLDEVGP